MKIKQCLKCKDNGMSLVEVLVAMGLAAVVSLAVMRINQSGMKGASAISSKIGLKMWQGTVLYRHLSKEPTCAQNFGAFNMTSGGTRNDLVREDGTPFASAGQVIDGSSGTWRLAPANAIRMAPFAADAAGSRTGSCDLTISIQNMKENYAAESMDLHVPMRCTLDSGGNFLACAMSTDGSDSLWSLQLANGGNPSYIHHNGNVFIGPGGQNAAAPLHVQNVSGTEWPGNPVGTGLYPAIRIEGDDHPLVFDFTGIWETGTCLWFGIVPGGGLQEKNAFCASSAMINSAADTLATISGSSTAISATGNPAVTGNFSVTMGDGNDIAGNNSLAVGIGNNIEGGANNFVTGSSNTSGTGSDNIMAGNQNDLNNASLSLITGQGNTITNANGATLVGLDNNATGNNSFAAGDGNLVSGESSAALGGNNIASGIRATAIGNLNTASGNNSFVSGQANSATTFASAAFGNGNVINGTAGQGFAAGYQNVVSAANGIALGVNSVVNGTNGMAVGREAQAGQEEFVAQFDNGFQFDANAAGFSHVGNVVFIDELGNLIVGMSPAGINPVASDRPRLAIGGTRVAIGLYSRANHNQSIAISPGNDLDHRAEAFGGSSTAIGYSGKATGSKAMALGVNDTSLSTLGGANRYQGTWARGESSFAVGHNAEAGAYQTMAIGTNLHVNTNHDNTVMLGTSSWAPYDSTGEDELHLVGVKGVVSCVGVGNGGTSDEGKCLSGMVLKRTNASPPYTAVLEPLSTSGQITLQGFIEGTWSARKLKNQIHAVNYQAIFDNLINLDVFTWKYKKKHSDYNSIGPMAEDFFEKFSLSMNLQSSKEMIISQDVRGVTLAATKAVALKTVELEQENAKLRQRVEEL